MLDVSTIYVPSVSLCCLMSPHGALRDQQVGLARILSNDLPRTGSQSMWAHVHALWGWNFCLLQPSGSPTGKPFWPSKPFWGLVFSGHGLELGSPRWGSDSSFLGEGLCNVIVLSSQLWVTFPGASVLTIHSLSLLHFLLQYFLCIFVFFLLVLRSIS